MLTQLSAGYSQAANPVSRPAGFVQIDVPPGESVSFATPWKTTDDQTRRGVLSQLAGAADAEDPDQLLSWNATEQTYEVAALDGVYDGEERSPGRGWIIVNRQPFWQMVFLAGAAALDPVATVTLYEGLNLVGNPFTARLEPDERSSGMAGGLDIAEAQWVSVGEAVFGDFSLERPYDNPFPTSGLPNIREIIRLESGDVQLRVAVDTAKEGSYTLLYQDLAPTTVLATASGWLLAAEGLGSTGGTFDWTDTGGLQRENPASVFGRCYLVVREDIDTDGDGLADGLETFVLGSRPDRADSDGDGMPDGWEIEHGLDFRRDDGEEDADRDGVPNIAEMDRGTDPRLTSSASVVLYVDSQGGSDTNDGLSRLGSDGRGAFQTIRAAFDHSYAGDQVVVMSGEYSKNYSAPDHDVKVRLEGTVRFIK